MRNFRRKSDVKRTASLLPPKASEPFGPTDLPEAPPSNFPSPLSSFVVEEAPVAPPLAFLPGLPPASDFRTSLILPDLSRRFTLLRKPSGDPATLDDLRDKLAEQRAKGAENQISEEEEDMILETLTRIRAKNARTWGSEDSNTTDSTPRASVLHHPVKATSPVSSTRSAKRYSNNLFASGKFRDYTYFRSIAQQKRGRSGSLTSVEDSTADVHTILDPGVPAVPSIQVDTEPPSPAIHTEPPQTALTYDIATPPLLVIDSLLPKNMTPLSLNRASLALEEAMKQIEEEPEEEEDEAQEEEDEAEEEIVMPRIPPASRLSHTAALNEADNANAGPAEFETGTAMTSDTIPDSEQRGSSPLANGRPGSVSPTPRLPGYIPGMPRPMTPRDLETDEQRSLSTTPRASSPIVLSALGDRNVTRRASDASTSCRSPLLGPGNSTPMFLPRTLNGRFTPEERSGSNGFPVESEGSRASPSLASRRRPVSPLSGPAFQPLAVSSRPGTPSNVIWHVSPNSSPQKQPESVSDSWFSEGAISGNETRGNYPSRREVSIAGSPRSPTTLSSPVVDLSQSEAHAKSPSENQASPAVAHFDLGSPVMAPSRLRSPTPTQAPYQSPASPTFGLYGTPKAGNLSPQRSSQSDGLTAAALRNALVFSPIANSSRSSLESAGSSYHSLEMEMHKDYAFLIDSDLRQPPWHGLSSDTDKSSPAASDGACEAEEAIGRFAGLTKNDFVAIQEKLIGAAMAKASTPPARDRVPSLRRRRPSTSQSNYSVNGYDAKPQSSAGSDARSRHPGNISKANALLDSVVNSIRSPQEESNVNPIEDPSLGLQSSDPRQRHKDLTDALFGSLPAETPGPPADLSPSPPSNNVAPVLALEDPPPSTAVPLRRVEPIIVPTGSDTPSSSAASADGPLTPLSPPQRANPADLVKEVQRKTNAAMAELRRNTANPSVLDAPWRSVSTPRKRVDPNQISGPKFVSSSTSVDTIPLRPPSLSSAQQNSKISERLKKLKGSLRYKPTNQSSGDEVAPSLFDLRLAESNSADSKRKTGVSTGRDSRTSVTTPPASAGPSIKGFLGRLRRPRTAGSALDFNRPSIPLSPDSPSVAPPSSEPSSHQAYLTAHMLKSAPPETQAFNSSLTRSNTQPQRTLPQNAAVDAEDHSEVGGNLTETEDRVARRRFLDAALSLGIEEDEVNALLARKESTRSRLNADSSNIAVDGLARSPSQRSHQVAPYDGHPVALSDGYQITSTPPTATLAPTRSDEIGQVRPPRSNGRTTLDIDAARIDEATAIRKPSVRRRMDPLQEGQAEYGTNVVVRRTIIFPSEATSTLDLNFLLRKPSQTKTRRRSSSGGSIRSGRSVHDRAPTPPPPRSPLSKRFSRESPPVPRLPPSFASQAENIFSPPPPSPSPGPVEKTSSTYDSLYEMYAEESRIVTPVSSDAEKSPTSPNFSTEQTLPPSDSGPGLEVIELANGEMIWSIVNGLRDDDPEAAYPNRVSLTSEYSMQESSSEGVQVFFKEHTRGDSKSSTGSFGASKGQGLGKARPDTKVYYSSSAQIGRLIENLSQGMDAGSFNFSMPNSPAGRSNPSSYHSSENGMHWTIEETLDHMLKSVARPV